jgi:DNA-binding MurR/RpiR family transcriptional regulator
MMFRERIQQHYESLSPRFRSLADFILENTLDVGFMTATALARRVGVDPATVVRFSQELGYSGFRELSREIKDYINNQLALRYGREETELEGVPGEVSQLLDELSNRILDMKVDAPHIAEIVDLMRSARRIVITGTATGLNLAELWTTHLRLLGLDVDYIPADPTQAALVLRDMDADDLLIAIALGLTSGSELGHMINTAIELGVKTVSITANPTLLPAREANVNLVVPAKTPSGYPSFDTITAILSILWQTLITVEKTQADQGVKSSMDMVMKLVNQRDRIPAYDSAALQRMWEPN